LAGIFISHSKACYEKFLSVDWPNVEKDEDKNETLKENFNLLFVFLSFKRDDFQKFNI
jgi:hypothetical protein